MPFQGLPNVLTPLEASRVLARAEFRMRPAHDVALAAGVEVCKQEKCSHFIQPKDLIDGGLRNILVPSDYDVLTSVSNVFIDQKVSILKESITLLLYFKYVYIFNYIQDDPSRTELQDAVEKALQFPTAATLKDLEAVEGDFEGNFYIYCMGERMFETLNSQSDSHLFVYLHFQLSNLNKISGWLNLQRPM